MDWGKNIMLDNENNNNDHDNDELELFSLGNGFIASKSDACSDLIEDLLDNGMLWEFISALINSYADKEDVASAINNLFSVHEIGKRQEEELSLVKGILGKDIAQVLQEVKGLKELISNGTLVSSASVNNSTPGSAIVKETTVNKSRIKKNTNSGGAKGGFGAKANKIQALARK